MGIRRRRIYLGAFHRYFATPSTKVTNPASLVAAAGRSMRIRSVVVLARDIIDESERPPTTTNEDHTRDSNSNTVRCRRLSRVDAVLLASSTIDCVKSNDFDRFTCVCVCLGGVLL